MLALFEYRIDFELVLHINLYVLLLILRATTYKKRQDTLLFGSLLI
jgi:hypothetical protein